MTEFQEYINDMYFIGNKNVSWKIYCNCIYDMIDPIRYNLVARITYELNEITVTFIYNIY